MPTKDTNCAAILLGTPVRAETTALLSFYAMDRNLHVRGTDAVEHQPSAASTRTWQHNEHDFRAADWLNAFNLKPFFFFYFEPGAISGQLFCP